MFSRYVYNTVDSYWGTRLPVRLYYTMLATYRLNLTRTADCSSVACSYAYWPPAPVRRFAVRSEPLLAR